MLDQIDHSVELHSGNQDFLVPYQIQTFRLYSLHTTFQDGGHR
jgi:hypothetical protein